MYVFCKQLLFLQFEMSVIIFVLVALAFGYAILIMYYYEGWESTNVSNTNKDLPPVKVSVIIPARNEEKNIGQLLDSILTQDYEKSLLQIIVIDDNSEDETARIVKTYEDKGVQLFNLKELLPDYEQQNAYKKRAIEQAVIKASGELIVTTDADCVVPQTWISAIVSLYVEKKPRLITGPVSFSYNTTLFQKFQALDFISMIGITAASIQKGMFNLANGANLAYEKKAFLEVNGYSDIDQKASGDDMFLIYKIASKYKNEVAFLKNKDAIVTTRPNETLKEFVDQRFRWTSKSFSYQDKRITAILAGVYLYNLLILICFFAALFGLMEWKTWFNVLFSKMAVDYIFLRKVSVFFGQRNLLRIFLISEVLHVFYIVIIGSLGNFIKSQWKGRTIK